MSPSNAGQVQIDRGASAAPKGLSVQRTVGFAAIGLGAVGLAVGTIFGLKTSRKNDEIDSICPPGVICGPEDQQRYQTAVADGKSFSTLSTIGFVSGGVLVGAGIVTILTAPRSVATGFGLHPLIGRDSIGAEVGGAW